ncbi:unnamed protein product [Pleuronectes platessa]|uniref:Uncharacterized protein n=1 Tax=Pleuronectes platessa TaxID=8262 RepID=A0A9N7YST8_PLEPL|nr:unnamed protein product [Pleuronectes platessa]
MIDGGKQLRARNDEKRVRKRSSEREEEELRSSVCGEVERAGRERRERGGGITVCLSHTYYFPHAMEISSNELCRHLLHTFHSPAAVALTSTPSNDDSQSGFVTHSASLMV